LTRYTYTGREYDSDTRLYYYRARFYDPHIGRFVSEDPIGFGGGDVNLYSYVGNNGLNYLDPFGFERLRYTMVPGKPPPPIITNPARLPDFYAGQINIGGVIGWSGQIIIDRNGNVYLQGLGFNFGKSATFVSGSLTAGWINQRCEPSQKRLSDVLSDQSVGVGGGYYGGMEFTGNQSGTTTQIGLFLPPQIGGNWGYSSKRGNIGLTEPHWSWECGCP